MNNNTASIVVVVAKSDANAIVEVYGKPDRNDDSNVLGCRRLAYRDGFADVESALSKAIKAGVPVVGDIAPIAQQPELGFCAVNGHYSEWPHVHGEPCVRLCRDAEWRFVVDRKSLQQVRAFLEMHELALQTLQQRSHRAKTRRTP
ncbi:MAG: hypothetical protein HUU46_07515 [Candidatus Hydrogenedentes bacterium]|nr:hypothetical protein [Candidatus Hydrogenedentota bacterium]